MHEPARRRTSQPLIALIAPGPDESTMLLLGAQLDSVDCAAHPTSGPHFVMQADFTI